MVFLWGEFRTFEDFLGVLEDYVDRYFTQNILFVRQLGVREWDEDGVVQFLLSTEDINMSLSIHVPEMMITDTYIVLPQTGERYINTWNGVRITDEQLDRLVQVFERMIRHYHENEEAFMEVYEERLPDVGLASWMMAGEPEL